MLLNTFMIKNSLSFQCFYIGLIYTNMFYSELATDLTTPSVNPAKMVVADGSTVTGAQIRLDPPDVY